METWLRVALWQWFAAVVSEDRAGMRYWEKAILNGPPKKVRRKNAA